MEVFPDQPPAGNHVGREQEPDEAEHNGPGYGEEVYGILELVTGVPLLAKQDQIAFTVYVKDRLVVRGCRE